jgi:hypothetical protein
LHPVKEFSRGLIESIGTSRREEPLGMSMSPRTFDLGESVIGISPKQRRQRSSGLTSLTAVSSPNNNCIDSLADFGKRPFEFDHRYLRHRDGTIFPLRWYKQVIQTPIQRSREIKRLADSSSPPGVANAAPKWRSGSSPHCRGERGVKEAAAQKKARSY